MKASVLALALCLTTPTILWAATTADQPTTPSPAPVQDVPTKDNAPLAVDSVRMREGYRAGRVIGATVVNDQKQQVGRIDDLLMENDNKAAVAIISVGGFLGIGNKLVAVPFDQLQIDRKGDDLSIMLPNASKDMLTAMPTFKYN